MISLSTKRSPVGNEPFGSVPLFAPTRLCSYICRMPSMADRLSQISNVHMSSLRDFRRALKQGHDEFHVVGAALVGPRAESLPCGFLLVANRCAYFREGAFRQRRQPLLQGKFAAFMMLCFGRLDAEKGWTKQPCWSRTLQLRRVKERGERANIDNATVLLLNHMPGEVWPAQFIRICATPNVRQTVASSSFKLSWLDTSQVIASDCRPSASMSWLAATYQFGAAPGRDHICATSCQPTSQGQPNAAGSTNHDCRFITEV